MNHIHHVRMCLDGMHLGMKRVGKALDEISTLKKLQARDGNVDQSEVDAEVKKLTDALAKIAQDGSELPREKGLPQTAELLEAATALAKKSQELTAQAPPEAQQVFKGKGAIMSVEALCAKLSEPKAAK